MHSLLKISEAASLALHTAVILAGDLHENHSTKDLAKVLGASEAHLAKVLQRLAREGLVSSQRGPKGGFVLNRDPSSITLLDVYEAAEGPMETSSCLLGTPACNGNCILGDLLTEVTQKVSGYFANTTLADLAGSFPLKVSHARH